MSNFLIFIIKPGSVGKVSAMQWKLIYFVQWKGVASGCCPPDTGSNACLLFAAV